MAGSSYPETPAYYDALLKDVAEQRTDMPSMQSGMDGWQTFGAVLQSVLRPAGATDSYSASDPLMPDSLGTLVKNHLSGWTGTAADEFTKQVNVIAAFGHNVGLTMYDAAGEVPQSQVDPGSFTFHRALSDLQDALNLIRDARPKVNAAYANWASTLANNIYNYSYGMHGSQNPCAGLPDDWETTTCDVTYYSDITTLDASTGMSNGVEYFTINDGIEPSPLYLNLPGFDGSGQNAVDKTKTSVNWIKDQITQHFTLAYRQRLGALADLIISPDGTYTQVGHQLPAKLDESSLPKGQSKPGNGNGTGNGVPFSGGGFGGGGGGFGGGGGGKGGGTGGGGSPGGGGGFGGGGSPGGGGGGFGSGGSPGGGSGGFGGGGSPGGGAGGFGGGGSSGGGSTKIAGVGPGGPGGLGPLGGGGGVGGGAAGIGAGGIGGLAGGTGGGLGGTGALGSTGAAAGAAGANGSAMPMMPPMMPPMAGAAGQNDNTRQRKSWLPDDEEIWGDDSAAVPPVISSDI